MSLLDPLTRMPHRGPMLLIESVVEISAERILCRARDHRHPDYPLRRRGRLMTAALAELGAQAAAAHASVHGVGGKHIGLLLALRNLSIACPDADVLSAPIEIGAERLDIDGTAARYRFALDAAGLGKPALTGEAILSIRGVA